MIERRRSDDWCYFVFLYRTLLRTCEKLLVIRSSIIQIEWDEATKIHTKVSFVFNNRIAKFWFFIATFQSQVLIAKGLISKGLVFSYILQFNENCVCKLIWKEIDASVDIKIHYEITEVSCEFRTYVGAMKTRLSANFSRGENRKKKSRKNLDSRKPAYHPFYFAFVPVNPGFAARRRRHLGPCVTPFLTKNQELLKRFAISTKSHLNYSFRATPSKSLLHGRSTIKRAAFRIARFLYPKTNVNWNFILRRWAANENIKINNFPWFQDDTRRVKIFIF